MNPLSVIMEIIIVTLITPKQKNQPHEEKETIHPTRLFSRGIHVRVFVYGQSQKASSQAQTLYRTLFESES
jgi:hypothetical protein